MYSRILFVAALIGAANAIKLGAHQETQEAAAEQVVVDTTDNVPADVLIEGSSEGVKETEFGEADYQESGEYMQGQTGEYTAEDGTTFVTGAKE